VRSPSLVLASSNAGKLREFRVLLSGLELSLRGLGEFPDVVLPEEGEDYRANAIAKAQTVARATGLAALADDSGLEVEALGGAPGVRSARQGGPGLDDAGRLARLLEELSTKGADERGACFVCVVALALPEGPVRTARGECPGRLRESPSGTGGFGYDPIFEPLDARGALRGATLAELPAAEKNRISHRARAVGALLPELRHWLDSLR